MHHRLTRRWKQFVAVLVLVGLTTVATACNSQTKATRTESKIRDSSYSILTSRQPAHQMSYSPTRATINTWIDTWNKPGALAYVYLQNASGDIIGYYILKGPPVTACAALTPPYAFVGTPDDGSNAKDQQVRAPSVDGVYYSGGQCAEYYGIDASTGSLIDYTVGLGINVLLYSQPLPRQRTQNAHNLGPSGK